MRNFNFDSLKKESVISNVIAEGETTGHKHQIIAENQKDFTVYKSLEDECFLLKVLNKTKIVHEEHHSLPIIPGNYRTRIVREYDHLKEEARKVVD